MPGVYRYGINQLRKMLQPLVSKGLQSILLFGVSKHLKKVMIDPLKVFQDYLMLDAGSF